MIGSIAVIFFATLLPVPGKPTASPFCLVCAPLGGVDAVLNVLLFVPLGAAFALSGVRRNRGILGSLCFSILVESAQFFLVEGRDASFGDVLTNTLGGALGFVLVRHAGAWLRPPPHIAARLAVASCMAWFGIQWLSSFALKPAISGSTYYGQIARDLVGFEKFPGRVLSVTAGESAISDASLPDGDSTARRILGGAAVVATVTRGSLTTGIAPIVRVVDDEGSEILLLAQDGSHVVLGIRTGAAILRVRPPLFALPSVFSPNDATRDRNSADMVVLGSAYRLPGVEVSARDGPATRSTVITPTSALGWTFILPAQWYIEVTPTEVIFSFIWMASLILPFGYWAACASTHSRAPNTSTPYSVIWVALSILIAAWLALAPRFFGLSATPFRDWLALCAGILVGGILGSRTLFRGSKVPPGK